MQELMTIDEAADYLRVSVYTVRDYISEGRLEPRYTSAGKGPGKPVRVLADQVRNFFACGPDGSIGQNGSPNNPEPVTE